MWSASFYKAIDYYWDFFSPSFIGMTKKHQYYVIFCKITVCSYQIIALPLNIIKSFVVYLRMILSVKAKCVSSRSDSLVL